MTRTLFFLTALSAMLATVTAVLIRIELYAPGVTPLFQRSDGSPNGAQFNDTSRLHGLFAYLTVIVLGTTMISAARDKGTSFGRVFLGLGLGLCVAMLAYIALSILPVDMPSGWRDQSGVGWVLYPPLSTGSEPSYLEQLVTSTGGIGQRFLSPDASLRLLPTAAVLYLGAYTMLATEPGFGKLGAVAFTGLVVFGLMTAGNLTDIQLQPVSGLLVLIALPLLACGAIRLIDVDAPWLLMLTLGLLTCLIGFAITLLGGGALPVVGTFTDVALQYLFPNGLAWYALPALLLYTHQTRLSTASVLGLFAAITVGLTLWIAPLYQLGLNGQQRHYIDYPSAFAPQNAEATSGVALFMLTYLAVIVIIRRNRLSVNAGVGANAEPVGHS